MGIRFSTGVGPFRVSVPLTGRRRTADQREAPYQPRRPRLDRIFVVGGAAVLAAFLIFLVVATIVSSVRQ
jgi:hypothetical protein